MNTDEKILKALEDLQAGQKELRSDVQQQGKQLDHQGNTLTHQGKLLNGIAANMGTVLEEQQAQRLDIRSLHTEVHASKDELKAEILSARAEAKADSIDVKATVLKKNQSYERRITNLEEHEGVENPDKN